MSLLAPSLPESTSRGLPVVGRDPAKASPIHTLVLFLKLSFLLSFLSSLPTPFLPSFLPSDVFERHNEVFLVL